MTPSFKKMTASFNNRIVEVVTKSIKNERGCRYSHSLPYLLSKKGYSPYFIQVTLTVLVKASSETPIWIAMHSNVVYSPVTMRWSVSSS